MWRRFVMVLFVVSAFFALQQTAWSEAYVQEYKHSAMGVPFILPYHPGAGNPNNLLAQVNLIRKSNHLPPLRANVALSHVAEQRAADMQLRQYYAHQDPDGLYYYDHLKKLGVMPEYSCENLDLVSADSQVVSDWLNSSKGHRECLLNQGTIEAGYAIIPFMTDTVYEQSVTTYLVVAIHTTPL